MIKNLFSLFFTLILIACGSGSNSTSSSTNNTSSQYSYTWVEATPASVGLSATNVTAALNYAIEDGKYTQSAIIVKDGKIIGEQYRSISQTEKNNLIAANTVLSNSFLDSKMSNKGASSLVSSWSVGKSFTSVIFGIAQHKGLLSINSNASDYITEWSGVDERSNISIKNLLDMRSGLHQGCYNELEADEIGNCSVLPAASSIGGGNIARATNQLEGCINQTFNSAAHGTYNSSSPPPFLYSNCDTMILGEIFYRATNQDINEFAQTNLFAKLDINAYWWRDNSTGGQNNGNYLSYCCIDMTARDFIKFGQLLLDDGIWNEERLLSSSYVQQIKDLTEYGYKFWHAPSSLVSQSPVPSINKLIYANGFDGQYIFIDFENKILIARNSLYYPALDLSSERKMVAGTIGTTNFPVTSPMIITTNGTRIAQTFNPFLMARYLYDPSINNIAPVISSSASFSTAENQTAIGTVTATDADGDDGLVTFTVSGAELAITSAGGVLTFRSPPDYETKSSYTATVTASDGTGASTQSITVNVTDVNDNSPVFTSSATFNGTDDSNQIYNFEGYTEAVKTTDLDINKVLSKAGDKIILEVSLSDPIICSKTNSPFYKNSDDTDSTIRKCSVILRLLPRNFSSDGLTYTVETETDLIVVADRNDDYDASHFDLIDNGTVFGDGGNPAFSGSVNLVDYLKWDTDDWNIPKRITISINKDIEELSSTGLEAQLASDSELYNGFDPRDFYPDQSYQSSFTPALAFKYVSPVTYSISNSNISIDPNNGELKFVNPVDIDNQSTVTATVTANDGLNSSTQNITISITPPNL
jgi:CubicO group peptidase (beta-lactamase class C family)|tara:strand:+ start:17186 stop:19633 length:2448 start_codon:yes stop_codon:yes gene_type:complete